MGGPSRPLGGPLCVHTRTHLRPVAACEPGTSASRQACWVGKYWLGLLGALSSPSSWWFCWVSFCGEHLEHPQTTSSLPTCHIPGPYPPLSPGTPNHVGPLGGAEAAPSSEGCVGKWGVFLEGVLFLLTLPHGQAAEEEGQPSLSISSDRAPNQLSPLRGRDHLCVD